MGGGANRFGATGLNKTQSATDFSGASSDL